MNNKELKKAINHLKNDPVMAAIIGKTEPIDYGYTSDPFEDLVYSIVSQQLSDKVSETIFGRIKKLIEKDPPTPGSILEVEDEELRSCGISYSKITYIKNISREVDSGRLDLNKINTYQDQEVVTELTKIKGIGQWTAEMFLIFTLKRPDIFSVGDVGLRNAVSRHYGVDKKDIGKINEVSLKWSPYRSVASRFLWKSL